MRLTQRSPKGDCERHLVSPVVVHEVWEKRMRQKDTSSTGINCGAGLITGPDPPLPIEPFPFIGNLVRQRLLSLVVDGTDGDPTVPETVLLPAVADQVVILILCHRVDLVTILKLEAAMLDSIHDEFLQRGPKMELLRFHQTHGRPLNEPGHRALDITRIRL